MLSFCFAPSYLRVYELYVMKLNNIEIRICMPMTNIDMIKNVFLFVYIIAHK